GLVAATGTGKTTLMDVILGLLKREKGEIVLYGVVMTESNLKAWQKSIGYVPQHIFLTDSSVAENIAFGVPRDEIDMEAVRNAAKIAQIDDFVMNELPYGNSFITKRSEEHTSELQSRENLVCRLLLE